jgi:dethiobiotin synthetase
MAPGYFITGTDTGVGKTLIACALLRVLAAQGKRVVGMKPVAAGASEGAWHNEDVAALAAASNVAAERAQMNPYLLDEPVAPHIAAHAARVTIDLAVIERAYAHLRALADVVIVEGVGGFLVPLDDQDDASDIPLRLALPVILVVGVRLGCLNHALLTAEAIGARGLVLAGWVANRIDPQMRRADENITALRQRIAAPLLGVVPFLGTPDAAIAVQHLKPPISAD